MPSIRRGKIVGEENAFIREKKRERKNAVHNSSRVKFFSSEIRFWNSAKGSLLRDELIEIKNICSFNNVIE